MANIAKTKYTPQAIANMSFDDQLKVSMVEIIGADGNLKNPSTSEKQDLILAKQDLILAELQSKTEPSDHQNIDILPVLRSMLGALVNPPWLDKSANVIRNQVQSGTITTVSTVTTVTTVTNLTNFGSQGADVTYRINNNNAWANVVRDRIT